MALRNVIYLTGSEYETLYNGGSITKGGVTYTWNANDLYFVPDDTSGYTAGTGISITDSEISVDTTTIATKTYVDGKVTGVYVFKGSVPTYADLPTNVTVSGWVYNVVATGMNYASIYENETLTWDALGGSIDLTNYYTKQETDTAISSHHDSTKQDALGVSSTLDIASLNAATLTVGNSPVATTAQVNAKSTVSVSASGTATDTVGYITVDGTEKKLAGGREFDNGIRLMKTMSDGATKPGPSLYAQSNVDDATGKGASLQMNLGNTDLLSSTNKVIFTAANQDNTPCCIRPVKTGMLDLGRSTQKIGTICANSLSDGTTTKSIAEVLAGGTLYSAGSGISIDDSVISADTTVLQEKLTAGSNINITNNTISATDTTYTAGTGISISDQHVISVNGTVYRYKGSVPTYADLPASGNEAGDTYNVVAAYQSYPAGTNFAWTGTAWDALGGSVDLSAYRTAAAQDVIDATKSTVTGTSSGDNWTSITIDGTTKSIPSGGGGSTAIDEKTIVLNDDQELETAIGGWKETTTYPAGYYDIPSSSFSEGSSGSTYFYCRDTDILNIMFNRLETYTGYNVKLSVTINGVETVYTGAYQNNIEKTSEYWNRWGDYINVYDENENYKSIYIIVNKKDTKIEFKCNNGLVFDSFILSFQFANAYDYTIYHQIDSNYYHQFNASDLASNSGLMFDNDNKLKINYSSSNSIELSASNNNLMCYLKETDEAQKAGLISQSLSNASSNYLYINTGYETDYSVVPENTEFTLNDTMIYQGQTYYVYNSSLDSVNGPAFIRKAKKIFKYFDDGGHKIAVINTGSDIFTPIKYTHIRGESSSSTDMSGFNTYLDKYRVQISGYYSCDCITEYGLQTGISYPQLIRYKTTESSDWVYALFVGGSGVLGTYQLNDKLVYAKAWRNIVSEIVTKVDPELNNAFICYYDSSNIAARTTYEEALKAYNAGKRLILSTCNGHNFISSGLNLYKDIYGNFLNPTFTFMGYDYESVSGYRPKYFTLQDSGWSVTNINQVTGTNDGTNWQTLTINGVTKAIPSGGGASYTAGTGIDITDNTISVDTTTIQEKVTAGDGIYINGSNEISASVGSGLFFDDQDRISLNNATTSAIASIANKQDAATAYNTSNIVYSSTEPASATTGMIWLKPLS